MPTSISIRPATLADAPAISAVHSSNIAKWQRWEGDHRPSPARYEDLSPYQRWLNGGPWLDAGTTAFHLGRLANGGGQALVAELQGRVLAEAEFFIADEPAPYGRNLNLSVLYVHHNHQRLGLGSALLEAVWEQAKGCETFLIANAEAPDFYRKHGFKLAERWKRVLVPVQATKAVYEAELLADGPYEVVRGWGLPIGRYQNAHHDWERVRPGAVPDFEEWRDLKGERFGLQVGHQRAVVAFEEQTKGVANTFLFAPTGYTEAAFAAVRDLALKRGFETLQCFVKSDLTLSGAMKTDYAHQLFRKKVNS